MNADERTCPQCAETIKSAADVCRYCGHRFKGTSQSDGPRNEGEAKVAKYSKIGCAAVVIGLIALISLCSPDKPNKAIAPSGAAPSESGAEENPFDDVSKQSLWIIKSRDSIKKRLRDPDSAEFRDVRFYSGGSVPVVCGEVNAKNGLGGYSGYEKFIASGDNVDIAFLASDVAEGDSINIAWRELCVKAPRDEAYVP